MNKPSRDATRQAKGSIKEAIGMLIGNPIVQAEGAAEKMSAEQMAEEPAAPATKSTLQP